MDGLSIIAVATWLAAMASQAQPVTLREAEQALVAERFAEASAKFRSATVAEPNNPGAWYGLGKSYEALARQAFSRLQATAADSEWEALIIAEVLVSADRFAPALDLYRQVQRQHPGIAGLHESIATLYERAGKPEWAATERARATTPPASCPPAAPDCEFLASRFLAAVAATGARTDAASLSWRTRAYNALATSAFDTLDGLPPSAEVHLVRAAIDRDQGRPIDAIPELKAALALQPGDRAIEQELATALYETRNLDEALPLLARLAGPPSTASPDMAFFYGDALLQAQQIEQALPYLRAAAARRPDAAPVRASLGRALLQSGDAAAALPHLQAGAKGDDPDSDGTAHYQLAQAYQRLGRAAEAKLALTEYRRRQAAAQSGATAPASGADGGITPP
jgi:predicted Zn-dependent protease